MKITMLNAYIIILICSNICMYCPCVNHYVEMNKSSLNEMPKSFESFDWIQYIIIMWTSKNNITSGFLFCVCIPKLPTQKTIAYMFYIFNVYKKKSTKKLR